MNLESLTDVVVAHTELEPSTLLGAPEPVKINSLIVHEDHPRGGRTDALHVAALTGVAADVDLPPILVARERMRIIDGVHRVEAVACLGRSEIRAYIFDGPDDLGHLLSVHANVAHGLPLTLSERKAAATRLLGRWPDWSDRAIAARAGLNHKTVGSLRRSSTSPAQGALDTRLGRDGRRRPSSSTGRRPKDADLWPDDAKIVLADEVPTGERSRRDDDGADAARSASRGAPAPAAGPPPRIPSRLGPSPDTDRPPVDTVADLRARASILRRDPSIRSTEAGRLFLRSVELHTIGTEWRRLADALPAHCAELLAEVASRCARDWHLLSDELTGKVESRSGD